MSFAIISEKSVLLSKTQPFAKVKTTTSNDHWDKDTKYKNHGPRFCTFCKQTSHYVATYWTIHGKSSNHHQANHETIGSTI